MNDVQSIMGAETTPKGDTSFQSLGSAGPAGSKKPTTKVFKKPEGMSREVFNLLKSRGDSHDIQSVMPKYIKPSSGYRRQKAQIGLRAVRRYKWVAFENQARQDGLKLFHWVREDKMNSSEPYIFARFNKIINVPSYTNEEYNKYLKTSKWSKEETDYLLDLCRRFDLRWPVVHDRYDKTKFGTERSIEDLKERVYAVVDELANAADPNTNHICYDAEHERRRKEQLNKMWDRTSEEIEEEEELIKQMKIIESRKRERERKAQDLQKLISMGDGPHSPSPGGISPAIGKKKSGFRPKLSVAGGVNGTAFHPGDVAVVPLRFSDFRTAGAHLRTQEMKLPTNVGAKKLKNIEVILEQCKMEMNPMGTEAIVQAYNDFRSQVIMLQELKSAMATAEFELEALKNKLAAEGRHIEIEPRMRISQLPLGGNEESKVSGEEDAPSSYRRLTSYIDISTSVGNPGLKKRKAPIAPAQMDTRRVRKV